jgi:large subunit ribosomal protein L28
MIFATQLFTLERVVMARVCQITGKKTRVGNNVSHANNKTKRTFAPNIQKKRFFLPEENRWVTLKLSTKAIKTINKKGLYAVIKEAQADGYLKKY